MTRNEFYEFMNKPIPNKSLKMYLSWAAIIVMILFIGITIFLIIDDAYKEIYHPYGPYDISPISEEYFNTDKADNIKNNKGTLKIDSYHGDFNKIAIPDEINNKKVTEIEKFSFISDKTLNEVYIPSGVTYIGNMSFYDCSNLTMAYIPETVTKIGGWAFSGTNSDFKICAKKNSYAEKYCKDRGIKFEAVDF